MKFKIGDRVAVYKQSGRTVNTVMGIPAHDLLLLCDGAMVYRQQARLLKEKYFPQRIWINSDAVRFLNGLRTAVISSNRILPGDQDIEFVEVRKGGGK